MPLPDLDKLWIGETVNTIPGVGTTGLFYRFSSVADTYFINKTDNKGATLTINSGDWIWFAYVRNQDLTFDRITSLFGPVNIATETDDYYRIEFTGGAATTATAAFGTIAVVFNAGPEGKIAPTTLWPYTRDIASTKAGMLLSDDAANDPADPGSFRLNQATMSLKATRPWMTPWQGDFTAFGAFNPPTKFRYYEINKTGPDYVNEYIAEDAQFTVINDTNGEVELSAATWTPTPPPKRNDSERFDRLILLEVVSNDAEYNILGTIAGTSYNHNGLAEDSTGRLWTTANVDAANQLDMLFFYSDDEGQTWTQEPSLTLKLGTDVPATSRATLCFSIDKNTDTAFFTGERTGNYLYCENIAPGATWTAMTVVSPPNWNSVIMQSMLIPFGSNFRAVLFYFDNNSDHRLWWGLVDTTQSPWVVTEENAMRVQSTSGRGIALTWNHDGDGYLRSETGTAPAWDPNGVSYVSRDLVQHDGIEWRCLDAHTSADSFGFTPAVNSGATRWEPAALPNLYMYFVYTGVNPNYVYEFRLPVDPVTGTYHDNDFDTYYNIWESNQNPTSQTNTLNIADDVDTTWIADIYQDVSSTLPDDAGTFWLMKKEKGLADARANSDNWTRYVCPYYTTRGGYNRNAIHICLDRKNKKILCSIISEDYKDTTLNNYENVATIFDIETETFSPLFPFARRGDARSSTYTNDRGKMLKWATPSGRAVANFESYARVGLRQQAMISLPMTAGLKNVYAGAEEVSAFYVGGTPVDAIYAGTELVYG